jgi:hypothetical protein
MNVGFQSNFVSLKQSVRGSDDLTLLPISVSDATVVAGVTNVVEGTTSSPEVQTIGLSSIDGMPPVFRAGDSYKVTAPLADGSSVSRTITLKSGGSKGFDELVSQLNSGGLPSLIFSPSYNVPPQLVASYRNRGAIRGVMSLIQTAVGGLDDKGKVTSTLVRPQDIGPLSIHSGLNIELVGDPAGTPFSARVRLNGNVLQKNPVGAPGSTSLYGLQIGRALGATYEGSNDLLGVGEGYRNRQIFTPGSGIQSSPAVVTGSVTSLLDTRFSLSASTGDTKVIVRIDGVSGTLNLPEGFYTGSTLAKALEDQINQVRDAGTGRWIAGVRVVYDSTKKALVFTSGSTGDTADINVLGSGRLGLAITTKTKGSYSIYNEALE